MRLVYGSALAVALVALVSPLSHAQGQGMQETNRSVAGGGITAAGWQGMVDPTEKTSGVKDAKLEMQGKDLHVVTGPAITYWNPANKASGDYTVKATFTEPKFMDLMSHPHSYGIVIAGNDMGTDQATYIYCVAYGDGRALVRGFSPTAPRGVFTPLAPTANPAVHKAGAKGDPVTQDIMWTVKGDRAECSINGIVVAGYNKADLVAPGKLKSLDGVYGIRFTHNVEAVVAGFGKS